MERVRGGGSEEEWIIRKREKWEDESRRRTGTEEKRKGGIDEREGGSVGTDNLIRTRSLPEAVSRAGTRLPAYPPYIILFPFPRFRCHPFAIILRNVTYVSPSNPPRGRLTVLRALVGAPLCVHPSADAAAAMSSLYAPRHTQEICSAVTG